MSTLGTSRTAGNPKAPTTVESNSFVVLEEKDPAPYNNPLEATGISTLGKDSGCSTNPVEASIIGHYPIRKKVWTSPSPTLVRKKARWRPAMQASLTPSPELYLMLSQAKRTGNFSTRDDPVGAYPCRSTETMLTAKEPVCTIKATLDFIFQKHSIKFLMLSVTGVDKGDIARTIISTVYGLRASAQKLTSNTELTKSHNIKNLGRILWGQNFVVRTLIWWSSEKKFRETLV